MRHSAFYLLGLLVTCVTARALVSTSEYASLQSFFQGLHGSTNLPVDGMTYDDVESAFGPRIQSSTDNYDFHRGIDIDGTEGDNILAVTDGVFWEYRVFSGGGNTVILRHDFDSTMTINGNSYDHYYTYYMHLWDDEVGGNGTSTDDIVSGWTAAKDNGGVGTLITAGQHIGEMGSSGSSGGDDYADHLHMEVRVGTTNSLIFQLDNPSTTQHGFDPHMNPMLFFAPYTFGDPDYDPTLEADGEYTANDDLTVVYTVNDEQPLLNRFEVEVIDESDDSVVKSYVLDYNLRSGFDASEQELLDSQDTDNPYIAPLGFGDTAIAFSAQLVLPEGWLDGYDSDGYRVEVSAFDIWGNETANMFTVVPESATFALLIGAGALLWAKRRRA